MKVGGTMLELVNCIDSDVKGGVQQDVVLGVHIM
jgi:hypothetical protein